RGALLSAPRASRAGRPAGQGAGGALSRHEPDAAGGGGRGAGAAGDPAADQGLSAARGVRGGRGLCGPGLQHHRRLRGDGHRADARALRPVLPARPGTAGVRAGWNGAARPELPPLTPGERVRLVVRGVWSAVALVVLFAVFLLLREVDLVAERIAGRPVSAMGPAV